VSDNLRVLVDGCCSAADKPFKPSLRRTFIHSTFAFNITFCSLLLSRLYSFVSSNV
jgi:hypothetical protein